MKIKYDKNSSLTIKYLSINLHKELNECEIQIKNIYFNYLVYNKIFITLGLGTGIWLG